VHVALAVSAANAAVASLVHLEVTLAFDQATDDVAGQIVAAVPTRRIAAPIVVKICE
jgi:hypothetical protein